MKRRIALIGLLQVGLLAAVLQLAQAQSPGDTDAMVAANQLYESGQFAGAARAYEQLASRGVDNSALHYNLGNAHFKQGELGRAVLNYRRAERLAPRDPDIAANLDLARTQAVDRLDQDGEAFIVRVIELTNSRLTLNEMAIATLVAWFALLSLAATLLFARAGRVRSVARGAAVGVAATLAVGVIFLGGRLALDDSDREAVIVAGAVDVVSGPGSQYVAEFTLHAGAEVSVIEERGNWTRLELPGGELQGWVEAGAVERVERG